MTNEDREDLKRAIRKVLNDEPARMSIADRVLNEFDAKLSPKYPPIGSLIEFTADWVAGRDRHRVSEHTDFKRFKTWRRIVTAEDALKALIGLGYSASCSPRLDIQDLIDEAAHS